MDNLEFTRLKVPRLIPENLIESVKGRTFSTEQFYLYQEGQKNNPYNFLFALIDDQKKIYGYIWAEQNLLDGSLFINTFSIHKTYWHKGKAIDKAIEFIHKLRDKTQADKVFWITTNKKFFEKHGFKESKNHLMEFPNSVNN